MSLSVPSPRPQLIYPARQSEWLIARFNWWIGKMFRKDFASLRVARGYGEAMASLRDHRGPAIVIVNHSSWWDPLIGLHVTASLAPGRLVLAAMEWKMLQKFGFFRRMGVFGIEPDHPESLPAMVEYVTSEFVRDPRNVFWITPQGMFEDVRTPIRLRPGAATLAARLSERYPDLPVVAVAVEMPFWTDRKPELCIRTMRVTTERTNTTGWLRAMTETMTENAARLAELVMARDPAGFERVTGTDRTRLNPLYDLWLKLRGKDPTIVATDRKKIAAQAVARKSDSSTNSSLEGAA